MKVSIIVGRFHSLCLPRAPGFACVNVLYVVLLHLCICAKQKGCQKEHRKLNKTRSGVLQGCLLPHAKPLGVTRRGQIFSK